MSKFNWNLFEGMVKCVYYKPDFEPCLFDESEPYSLEDYINIFRYFFDKYKDVMNEEHPPLKRERLQDIMERMPYAYYDGELGGISISSCAYPYMIDDYFGTQFKNCDYRITHFMSDQIRIYRLYNCGWY